VKVLAVHRLAGAGLDRAVLAYEHRGKAPGLDAVPVPGPGGVLRGHQRPPRKKLYGPRRWVVERTLAWLSKCRAIPIRWDKKARNYLGLLKLACALERVMNSRAVGALA